MKIKFISLIIIGIYSFQLSWSSDIIYSETARLHSQVKEYNMQERPISHKILENLVNTSLPKLEEIILYNCNIDNYSIEILLRGNW